MKLTRPLNQNRDFRRLYARGRCVPGSFLVLYVAPNREGHNRLGITASKKLGGAVARNRARRLLKESYRLSEMQLKQGFDIVVVARRKILEVGCPSVCRALRGALKQARLLASEGEAKPN